VDDLARLELRALPDLRHLHVRRHRAVLVGDRQHARAVQRVQGDRLPPDPHDLDVCVAEDQQVDNHTAQDLPDVLARVAVGQHPLEELHLGGLVGGVLVAFAVVVVPVGDQAAGGDGAGDRVDAAHAHGHARYAW
jgi:hypothetical protein